MLKRFTTKQAQATGIARREYEAALETVTGPLREVQDLLRWHAWGVMEKEGDPEAVAALEAWRAVANAVEALDALKDMAGEYHYWANGSLPDGPLYEKAIEDMLHKFAPRFVERLRGE